MLIHILKGECLQATGDEGGKVGRGGDRDVEAGGANLPFRQRCVQESMRVRKEATLSLEHVQDAHRVVRRPD
jgi:hypothetical protein